MRSYLTVATALQSRQAGSRPKRLCYDSGIHTDSEAARRVRIPESGREKSRYGLREQKSTDVAGSASGYIASNQAQNFQTQFTKTGVLVEPRSADQPAWRWGLRVTGYGYGETLQPLSKTEMSSEAIAGVSLLCAPLPQEGRETWLRLRPWEGMRRARRADRVVCERRARGRARVHIVFFPPAGARKGRTPRPSGTAGREPQAANREFLDFDAESERQLGQGRMVGEGAAIQFVSADGTPVLGYDGLYAYDSRGQALPARLALKGESLSRSSMTGSGVSSDN